MASKFDVHRILATVFLFISISALTLFVVGFSTPYWIEQDISVLVEGTKLNIQRDLSNSIKYYRVNTTSNVGLLKKCVREAYDHGDDVVSTDSCEENKENWQESAMVVGIVAMVLGVGCLAVGVPLVFARKDTTRGRLSCLAVFLHLISTTATVAPLVIVSLNKNDVEVQASLTGHSHSVLGWSFYLGAVSTVLCAIDTLLYLVLGILSRSSEPEPAPPANFRSAVYGYFR